MNLLKQAKTLKDGVRDAYDVKRRKLRTVAILVTDRCMSRCKHCFIWNKKDNNDLSPEVIERQILDSDVISKDTYFELTGGEFLDHPQYEEILALFSEGGYDYMMLTNGMYPDQAIEAVRKYKVPNLYMSLDGLGETYKKVRGVDCADNVVRIIDELKDEVPIFLGYTICPWNGVEDLEAVKRLCEEKGVEFFIGAYQNPEFFDTTKPGGKISHEHEPYLSEFMRLHNPWMEQQVKIPCWNINTKCYIMGSGDVHLCQQKSLVLGNLHDKTLGEIWESDEVRAIHRKYRECNDCWLACNRPFDAQLAHAGSSFLPRPILNKWLGEYTWDAVDAAYKNGS